MINETFDVIENFAHAGGWNDADFVSRLDAAELIDELLESGWEVPNADDRDYLIELAEDVIDVAAVAAAIEAMDPDKVEAMVMIKMNAAAAKVDNEIDIAIADEVDGPYRDLTRHEIRDLGRWIKQTIVQVRADDEKPVFTEVIAPSHWASGLINNDWSSLSLSDDGEAEYERAMAFVDSLPGPVVGLPEELGFKATPYWTDTPDELAQDFSRYTVQVLRPSSDMASRGGRAPSDPSADNDATDEVLGPPPAARPKGPGLGG